MLPERPPLEIASAVNKVFIMIFGSHHHFSDYTTRWAGFQLSGVPPPVDEFVSDRSVLSSDGWWVRLGGPTVHHSAREPGIHRPRARTHDEQENQTQQHREIGARLVHHAQESVVRELGEREGPEPVSEQDRDFRREDGHRNVAEERDRRQAGEQAGEQERAANGFHRANEWPHHPRL